MADLREKSRLVLNPEHHHSPTPCYTTEMHHPLDGARPYKSNENLSSSEHLVIGHNFADSSSLLDSGEQRIEKAVKMSVAVNVALLLGKVYAVIASGSLAVLASLVDSVLDLVSQAVVQYAEQRSRLGVNIDFPAGQRRMEPVGVMCCAGLMCMASVEVIRESVESLLKPGKHPVGATLATIIIILATICAKLWLWHWCRNVARDTASSSVSALAQDHGNDTLMNAVALVALYLAAETADALWWTDSVAAIGLSIYIVKNWCETAVEQIEVIVGKAAPQDFLTEIRALADAHFPGMWCDQLRAYHFGPRFLVELEVVLPAHTPLHESHDLGMELQWKARSKTFNFRKIKIKKTPF